MKNLINIAIVEKNVFYRESLRTILSQIPDFRIISDTESYSDLMKISLAAKVDLVLLDEELTDSKCIQEIKNYFAKLNDVKILALSEHNNECFQKEIIQNGVDDIIQKHFSKKKIEEKIRSLITTK